MYVCMYAYIYMYISKLRYQNCTKTLVFANDAGGNLKT